MAIYEDTYDYDEAYLRATSRPLNRWLAAGFSVGLWACLVYVLYRSTAPISPGAMVAMREDLQETWWWTSRLAFTLWTTGAGAVGISTGYLGILLGVGLLAGVTFVLTALSGTATVLLAGLGGIVLHPVLLRSIGDAEQLPALLATVLTVASLAMRLTRLEGPSRVTLDATAGVTGLLAMGAHPVGWSVLPLWVAAEYAANPLSPLFRRGGIVYGTTLTLLGGACVLLELIAGSSFNGRLLWGALGRVQDWGTSLALTTSVLAQGPIRSWTGLDGEVGLLNRLVDVHPSWCLLVVGTLLVAGQIFIATADEGTARGLRFGIATTVLTSIVQWRVGYDTWDAAALLPALLGWVILISGVVASVATTLNALLRGAGTCIIVAAMLAGALLTAYPQIGWTQIPFFHPKVRTVTTLLKTPQRSLINVPLPPHVARGNGTILHYSAFKESFRLSFQNERLLDVEITNAP